MCRRMAPLNRELSRRAKGRNPTTTRKCMAVTMQASRSNPAPAAIPIAADSQIAAAVVNPCTDPRRKMMMPAPRKPMPETIWAATQDVGESVFADEKYQRRRGADDGLGANPGTLALQFALEADERRQAERDEQ